MLITVSSSYRLDAVAPEVINICGTLEIKRNIICAWPKHIFVSERSFPVSYHTIHLALLSIDSSSKQGVKWLLQIWMLIWRPSTEGDRARASYPQVTVLASIALPVTYSWNKSRHDYRKRKTEASKSGRGTTIRDPFDGNFEFYW